MGANHHILHTYVDESGQDTDGEIFLVAVVIVDEERDELRKLLRQIEKESGKSNRKWTRTAKIRREIYIRRVLQLKRLAGRLYYFHYRHTRDYVSLTILSTARAILRQARHDPYEAVVWVDGLNKHERERFTAGLRDLHIKIPRQARGLDDEADEFIRLADALAGFVRDGQEGDAVMGPLYKKAVRQKIIVKS
jgi:hypothetical protein